MANTLKFGAGNWATKEGSTLAYNDENENFKPLPFDFTRTSSATVVNKEGLIETVGSGEPRIDFLGNTKGALLLEPSRTNLIPYSEDFTQSTWQKQSAGVASAPVVTSNYSISPAGTLNADRIIFNIGGGSTSSDFSQITDPVTVSGGDVSNSVYIKSNTTANYTMSLVKPDGNFTTILVTTEWQRFEVNATAPSAAVAFRLRLRGSESTSDFSDVSVWGAQLEEGSFASSYIPTSVSAATRSADACNNGANEQVINSTEGVLYAEIESFISQDTVDPNRYITITNGTSNERIALLLGGNNSQLRAIIYSSSQSINLSFTTSLTEVKQFNKLAVKYKSGDYAFYLNGVEIGSSTESNIFSSNTLNNLSFNVGGGTQKFYGKCKDIRVYNEALTDAELQSLTTI